MRPIGTLATDAGIMAAGARYDLHETFSGYDAAYKSGKRLVKRYFPGVGTMTLWHDDEYGWHVSLYPDAQRARQLGLIG